MLERKKPKSAAIFAVFGDLDELVAVLGIARAFAGKRSLKTLLWQLQEDLIELGGVLSGAKKENFRNKAILLEREIAKIENRRVKGFSRPGKNKISAFLHLARTTARRLERRVVGLKEEKFKGVIAWLNRLSLLLFWLAVKEEK